MNYSSPSPQSIIIYANLSISRLFWLPPHCLCPSWWWGVGILPLIPSSTPVSAVISVLSSFSTTASLVNTTSIATPGGVTVQFLPVKSNITLQVTNQLTSVGSPATASAELLFPIWVQVCLTLTDKRGDVISILAPQLHM